MYRLCKLGEKMTLTFSLLLFNTCLLMKYSSTSGRGSQNLYNLDLLIKRDLIINCMKFKGRGGRLYVDNFSMFSFISELFFFKVLYYLQIFSSKNQCMYIYVLPLLYICMVTAKQNIPTIARNSLLCIHMANDFLMKWCRIHTYTY